MKFLSRRFNTVFSVVSFSCVLLSSFVSVQSMADDPGEAKTTMDLITDNIVKVCDKPENAGSYWDIKVKGGGEAAIKLKLAKLGLTGEAEFSKGEWDGVQKTVEDSKSYRECVRALSPMFLEKFLPLISQEKKSVKKKRSLGGVKWQEFGMGVNLTLDRCIKKASAVSCEFTANAIDDDVLLYIFGSSAIYDQRGNKYMSQYAAIANSRSSLKNSRASMSGDLVRTVDTPVVVRFNDVDDSAESVSKVMMNTSINNTNSGSRHTFAFRGVKIGLE